ncbi:MAG TPA: phosphoribosylformylglycinamidine cyclo-ligase [Solirubrobacteraceae bacterium]|nr:phosphoribosylformylglycinamidine cyclo-ligase [Solirubrobacteraceae bacterium]
MIDAYAAAGVDTTQADRGVRALVDVLRQIDIGRPSRSVLASGHYASVLEIAPGLGIALSTDGVGSKLIVAEATGRLDTVGVDCVAMNVNDIVCVGAEPIAMLDYIAVEQADPAALEQIGVGLRRGAELAGIEIPGGELAILPDLIRGHPSPHGIELSGTGIGTVALDRIVTGELCAPGDALIGLPASGLHSNGFSLARRILGSHELDSRPELLAGVTLADALLEPTVIYVKAVLELLRSDLAVHGLAHITGDGVLNLRRLKPGVGFEVDAPLDVPGICALICERGAIEPRQAYQHFNMGCGFVVVVAASEAKQASELLAGFHPGTRAIGHVTEHPGVVSLPTLAITL